MEPDGQRTGTILIVDDEPFVLKVLRGVLVRAGYQVLSAAHPALALELFEQQGTPICLLIADVVMPGMSGMELAERLLKVEPRMKVLLIAGLPDHPHVIAAVQNKGYWFLPKPFLPKRLVDTVREILAETPCQSMRER